LLNESTVTPTCRRLNNAAENETMPLIEQRIRPFRAKVVRILRYQQGLQIAGIIHRMRPGVTGQELKIIRKSAFQFNIQRVVLRIAVRQLSIYRTERRKDAGRSKRAGKLRIKNGLRYRSARKCLCEEIIRSTRPEKI